MAAVTEWWGVLRIPLAIAFAVIWFVLLRRRVVGEPRASAPPEKVVPVESLLTPGTTVIPSTTATDKNEPAAVIKRPESKAKTTETRARTKKAPKKFTRTVAEDSSRSITTNTTTSPPPEFHVFYASQFKHTSSLAQHLLPLLPSTPHLHDISLVPNLDDYFLAQPTNALYFLLLPSYANDSGPTQRLIDALEETLNDFRVDANPLAKLRFVVFGTGDKEGWPRKGEFCYQAVRTEKLMERLGAKRVFSMGMGDSKGRISLETQLEGWIARVLKSFEQRTPQEKPTVEAPEDPASDDEVTDFEEDEDAEETPLLDVEDIGPIAKRKQTPSSHTPKPMVSKTSTTYAALTKQGYTIVGTHSGVKICRWTKSALRGRGSCYKFSFYGIKSHLCMETTPSLACANKCVFCWRHGTNPVGTTWRWEVDDAETVYRGALEGHYSKIRMLRGMVGVKGERWEEAKRVRHCALSLVGEPIFCNSPPRNPRLKGTDDRSTYQ
jgi:tRNA wybutosine-synthesizing protein 1